MTFRKFFYALLLFTAFSVSSLSQGISTYSDKFGRFYVFDRGIIQTLEPRPVTDVQLGGDYVIYVDALSQVMYYRNGKKQILNYMPQIELYKPTRYFMISVEGNVLKVISNDKKHDLALGSNISYVYGDSIVAFIDFDRFLKVYAHNDLYEATNEPVSEFKASDNSIVYITEGENFYIVYNGKTNLIDNAPPNEYHLGNNFVAYLNRFNELYVYDNGDIQQLETIVPQSYKAGDNMVAYVNNLNSFNIYWDGETQELLPIAPRQYQVFDNTLMYIDERGFLNVFYKGKNQVLEAYTPPAIKMFEGIVAYTNLDGKLFAFYEGKKITVSDQIVEDFQVSGRVIQYNILNGETRFYYNGEHY